MSLEYSIPIILAQLPVPADPWWTPLANFGIAGIVIGWFMWRDKRDYETQDRRHQENIAAQKAIESAFRTNTESIIIGIAALQTIDASYKTLLDKVRVSNQTP